MNIRQMRSNLLIEARMKRGWTQAKVAKAVGVDVRTVNRWERGKAFPYPYYREQLCLLYDKTPQQLGLFSADEDASLEDTDSPDIQSTAPDISVQESSPADPRIPQSLESTHNLVGGESLLMQAKEHLFVGENVAHERHEAGIAKIDKIPLSLPENTDRDIPLKRIIQINRSKFLVLVLFCLAIIISGIYAAFFPLRITKPIEPPGLVGYWPFNEGSGSSTQDVSGNGNLAQINGATWTTGYLGKALSFNGSSDTVDINRPVVNTSTSFTVAAWVELSDLNGWHTVVSQDGNYVSGFFLQFTDSGQFAFSLASSDSPTAAIIRATSNFNAVAHSWYHLVGVYDAETTESSLYVNGILRSTQRVPPAWNASGETVIGRAQWNKATDFWSGQIKDVRLYNRALSATDVTTLYSSFT